MDEHNELGLEMDLLLVVVRIEMGMQQQHCTVGPLEDLAYDQTCQVVDKHRQTTTVVLDYLLVVGRDIDSSKIDK
jgi:hypothetical protein